MESTAFNRDSFYKAAWSTLHSITMHGIHCIQSGCFGPYCIKSTAFNLAAWNPMHSIMLHKIHAFKRVPILHTAWNPLHSIGMHFTTLHILHCIELQCIEFTAFNREAFYTTAWNPLHLITLHVIHGI